MVETATLLKTLGEKGLIERLDADTRKEGLTNLALIMNEVEKKDFNLLGAIYPALSAEQRTEALKIVLRVMGGKRYDYISRDYTPHIRDPQLLSDIGSSDRLYWPGLHDEEDLWKGKSLEEIRGLMDGDGLFHLDKIHSDFLVGYSLLRSDFTSFGEEIASSMNPGFLDRVLKGIVTLRFGGIKNEMEAKKGRERLYELLPKSLHYRVDQLRKEADWIVLKR